MKGNAKVVDLLNEVLTAELTAVNQYFLHAELCQHWGYDRLYATERMHSIDEMKHVEEVMERILFLDGMPNVQTLGKINIGQTVPEQLESDLTLELEAVARLNDGIAACVSAGDNASRHLLEDILKSEEEHVDRIESQQDLIKRVGLANYLAQQMQKDDD